MMRPCLSSEDATSSLQPGRATETVSDMVMTMEQVSGRADGRAEV